MLQHYNPLQAAENLALGAASVQSSTAPAGATHARIASGGNCHYLVGTNPTALAASTYLPAGVVEFVPCCAGCKIAVIQDGAATGNFNVTFCNGM